MCVRACVCVCVCARARACVYVYNHMCVYSFSDHQTMEQAPVVAQPAPVQLPGQSKYDVTFKKHNNT